MNHYEWETDEDTLYPDILPPGVWENDDGPENWFAVADADGIKAYAGDEELANLIAAAPALVEALEEAEKVIRWAAQEARGRIKAEIVGGWLHHADKIGATLKATKEE